MLDHGYNHGNTPASSYYWNKTYPEYDGDVNELPAGEYDVIGELREYDLFGTTRITIGSVKVPGPDFSASRDHIRFLCSPNPSRDFVNIQYVIIINTYVYVSI